MHAALADLAAVQEIDTIHCIGPLMRALHAALPGGKRGDWYETSSELLPRLRDLVGSGDAVLAKGSLSMKLGLVVDAIRKMGHGNAGPVLQDNE